MSSPEKKHLLDSPGKDHGSLRRRDKRANKGHIHNHDKENNLILFPQSRIARYKVVQSDIDVPKFVDEYLFKDSALCLVDKPGAIISVIGGAHLRDKATRVNTIIKRGIITAVQNLNAWIVDGGMHTGVMQYVGKCLQDMSLRDDVKCIGIAPLKRVVNSRELATEQSLEYPIDEFLQSEDLGNLDPNHTHFILVDSPDLNWGQETDFLNGLKLYLNTIEKIPVIVVALNGGESTLSAMHHGLINNFPTIIIEETDRACDALAAFIDEATKEPRILPSDATVKKIYDLRRSHASLKLKNAHEFAISETNIHKLMDEVLRHYDKIIRFKPADNIELDRVVLGKFLEIKGNTKESIKTAISWKDNSEVIEDLMRLEEEQANNNNRKETGASNPIASNSKAKELSKPTPSVPQNQAPKLAPTTFHQGLLFSLVMNRPNIFAILFDNNMFFGFPLQLLYEHDAAVQEQLNRGHVNFLRKLVGFPDKIRDALFFRRVNTRKISHPYCEPFERVLDLLSEIGPSFVEYAALGSEKCQSPSNSLITSRGVCIDWLIWAVFTNRMELAKVIWKRTRFHVHSAILASGLYRYLSEKAERPEEYLGNAKWFDDEALRVLTCLNYEDAKEIMVFTSSHMLGNANLIDTAAEGHCKTVMAHPHVQQRINEVCVLFYFSAFNICAQLLYSVERNGKQYSIQSRASLLQILGGITVNLLRLAATPFQSAAGHAPNDPEDHTSTPHSKSVSEAGQQPAQQPEDNTPEEFNQLMSDVEDIFNDSTINPICANPTLIDTIVTNEPKPLDYFRIPIVKFWTNVLFYLAYLIFQSYVLVNLRERPIIFQEFFLWGWMLEKGIEEILELTSHSNTGYFSRFTNKMDLTLLALNLAFIVLHIGYFITEWSSLYSSAVNTLLVSCVLSWLRLMAIFPASSTFGPMFFILMKLFTKDFVHWSVLFAIFAVSFQIGFSSLAIQAGLDPTEAYPADNGIFPVSLVAILGEWSYLNQILSKTPTGVIFLGIYAFIVQIMLVNLLIAMMGATYTAMRDTSDVDWKFYRRQFAQDVINSSALPPPLSVFTVLRRIMKRRAPPPATPDEQKHKEDRLAKVMRVTVSKLAEEQENTDNQSSLAQIEVIKQNLGRNTAQLQKIEDLCSKVEDTSIYRRALAQSESALPPPRS